MIGTGEGSWIFLYFYEIISMFILEITTLHFPQYDLTFCYQNKCFSQRQKLLTYQLQM